MNFQQRKKALVLFLSTSGMATAALKLLSGLQNLVLDCIAICFVVSGVVVEYGLKERKKQ